MNRLSYCSGPVNLNGPPPPLLLEGSLRPSLWVVLATDGRELFSFGVLELTKGMYARCILKQGQAGVPYFNTQAWAGYLNVSMSNNVFRTHIVRNLHGKDTRALYPSGAR